MKPPLAIPALANTPTEVTMSFMPYPKNSQETDLFSLPWSVFLMCATSTSPDPAVSYFCCTFDGWFLAAHRGPSFPTRLFTFNCPPASCNFFPLLFALFLHFPRCLSELHSKSKLTKCFLSPPCKTDLLGLLSSPACWVTLCPDGPPRSFELCPAAIPAFHLLITVAATSAACPTAKALPQQQTILHALCTGVSAEGKGWGRRAAKQEQRTPDSLHPKKKKPKQKKRVGCVGPSPWLGQGMWGQ